jgi:hypothetical protein
MRAWGWGGEGQGVAFVPCENMDILGPVDLADPDGKGPLACFFEQFPAILVLPRFY